VTIPRDLHPVAWWVWAVGLAVAATCTTNPFLLAVLLVVVTLTVLTCRGDQPWARSFRLYVWIGALVVLTRILFRIVLGGDQPGYVVLSLPEIPLPDAAAGISLLGDFTREEMLAASYEGLRLATLIIAVGAANALANPKRLMKSLPPALYEVGTAMTVAINVVPQLADSARRVRAAQELRGGATGRFRRIRSVRRLLVPILEDAFDRSLALAAGMDARGYGRVGDASPVERRATGALMLLGLVGICVGVYAVIDVTAPRQLAIPMIVLGALLSVGGMVSAGRRVRRTRYRADRWRLPEIVVALSGVACGAGMWAVQYWSADIANPGVDAVPAVSVLALVAALVGVLPVWVAPPPATAGNRVAAPSSTSDEAVLVP